MSLRFAQENRDRGYKTELSMFCLGVRILGTVIGSTLNWSGYACGTAIQK
jgi:hypothetical protein